MRIRRCRCDLITVAAVDTTTEIVVVKRFTHPWLTSKTVVQTLSHDWQPNAGFPIAQPYLLILDTPLWPWPGTMPTDVLNGLGKMLNLNPSRIALRVTEGDCAFHGDEDVRQPAIMAVAGWRP